MKNLPFPKSLLEFQQLFPSDAACATYMDETGNRVWPTGNSWGLWGQPYGSNKGGMWLATDEHILAATCLIVWEVAP